jgi:hypothetical protein
MFLELGNTMQKPTVPYFLLEIVLKNDKTLQLVHGKSAAWITSKETQKRNNHLKLILYFYIVKNHPKRLI